MRRDDLDGDVTVEVQLMGAIHHAHAAASDDRVEPASSEHAAGGQDAHMRGIYDRG
jgi:hypothetical protein